MKTHSKTDWTRVKNDVAQNAPIPFDAATDLYDHNDVQQTLAFLTNATVHRRGAQKAPTKVPTTIRFDADILLALKASGRGWQTRVNEAMREWVKTHVKHS